MSGAGVRLRRTGRAALSLFRVRLAEQIQYRVAALSNAAIATFWALIEITVIGIFFTYSNKAAVPGISGGMDLAQTVSYIWLGQMLHALQHMGIDGETMNGIRSGNIGVELCRPFHLYWHWFASNGARRVSSFCLRAPLVLAAALLMPAAWRIGAPASALHLICFFVSVINALLLSTAFGNLVYSVSLNVSWGQGPAYFIFMIAGVLSGSYLPLALWPEVMQGFLIYQPFAGLLDIPARLYIGTLAPSDAWFFWVTQWAWILLVLIAGRLLMDNRLKKIIVQGG